MQEIAIEDAKPGMKIACRVRNAGGDVMIDVGEVLTAEHISRCEKISIYTLHIFGKAVPNAPQSYDVRTCLERVPHLFRNHQENVFMKTLEAFLIKHLTERCE